ncbi:unnamed protein product [Mytilus coruscus]|uniref:Uncharacterized protein n=1 Tax=Mytilus coruscus TaxID=42192 RepID=A0A6J8CLH1_MYTCO|nr:unnamed protein product [Mytilus coruscus]
MPVGDAPSIPNTNQSINSLTLECPRTQKDWDDRAYEICPENKTRYNCVYDRNCSLVEVCKDPQRNNIEIVLLDKTDNVFFNQRQNEIYSNSMDYWMIQYPYCHKNFNTSDPLLLVEEVKTIEKLPWDYYLSWTIVVLLVFLNAIYLIYVYRQRCLSIYKSGSKYRHGQDSDKKENVLIAASSPHCTQPRTSRTVNGNSSSQNKTINKYKECNVDER